MLDINLFESINGINYGPWAGGQFVAMAKRHMAYKKTPESRTRSRQFRNSGHKRVLMLRNFF